MFHVEHSPRRGKVTPFHVEPCFFQGLFHVEHTSTTFKSQNRQFLCDFVVTPTFSSFLSRPGHTAAATSAPESPLPTPSSATSTLLANRVRQSREGRAVPRVDRTRPNPKTRQIPLKRGSKHSPAGTALRIALHIG